MGPRGARAHRRALNDDSAVLADELLGVLRDRLAPADVSYAEPLVRLSGGFFAESHGFCLAGAPPPWDTPLVVRLFPSSSPSDLARREAAVQAAVTEQGYPGARVLLFDEEARLLGRRFFVMERLPGRPLMDGIRIGDVAGSGWRLFTRLADVTATLQASLHRLDARPLRAELGDASVGIERWFGSIEAEIEEGADGAVRDRAGRRRRVPTRGGEARTPRRPPIHLGCDRGSDGRLLPGADRRHDRAPTDQEVGV